MTAPEHLLAVLAQNLVAPNSAGSRRSPTPATGPGRDRCSTRWPRHRRGGTVGTRAAPGRHPVPPTAAQQLVGTRVGGLAWRCWGTTWSSPNSAAAAWGSCSGRGI